MDVPLGFQRILKGGVSAICLAFLGVLLWASKAGADQMPLYLLSLVFRRPDLGMPLRTSCYQWPTLGLDRVPGDIRRYHGSQPAHPTDRGWRVGLAGGAEGVRVACRRRARHAAAERGVRTVADTDRRRDPVLHGLPVSVHRRAPDPADTIVSCVLLFCTLLFAMAMVSQLSVKDILIGLTIGYSMIVLPSLAISPFAVSFAPVNADSLGEADRLRGFANHPVSLAAVCAMLMVCCAALMYYMPKRRPILIGIIILALATLMLSQSRMALVAVLISGFIFWPRVRPGASWLIPIGVLAATAITLTTASIGLENILPNELVKLVSRSGNVNELLTLTGRSVIWDFTLHQIAEAPILGHGHNSSEPIFLERFTFSR